MGPSEMTPHPLQGPDLVHRRPDDQGRYSEGELPERVYPRDVIHYIPGQYGDFAGRNLEWHGDGLAEHRLWTGACTMATISAELSAEFSLFPYDDVLEEYLEGRAKWPFEPAYPDDDAEYEQVITVDLSSLEPQVVLPGQGRLELAGSVSEVAGQKVDQAFIGSCANGRLSDFAVAAEIVKGQQVAPGTRFIVTPRQSGDTEAGRQGRLRRDPDGGRSGGDQLDVRRLLRWAYGAAGRRRGVHHGLDPELQGPHG